ncbi:hypothetical protein [Tessaracoccus sp. Z1128]
MIVEVPAGAARVSLRRVSEGAVGDVVGHLLAANDQWLVLLPEDRPAVWVSRAEAESIRTVPERTVLPVSRPDDVERALQRMRPAARRARLGGWWLTDAVTLAIGDPGMPLDEALAAVEGWSGAPARVRCVADGPVAAFAEMDLRVRHTTVVLTADADPAGRPGAVPLTRGWALDIDSTDVEALAAAVAAGFTQRYRTVTMTRP